MRIPTWSTSWFLLAAACGSAPSVAERTEAPVPAEKGLDVAAPRLELRDDRFFRLDLHSSDSGVELRFEVRGEWHAAGGGMFMLTAREQRWLFRRHPEDDWKPVREPQDLPPEPGHTLCAFVDRESERRDGAWRRFDLYHLRSMTSPPR